MHDDARLIPTLPRAHDWSGIAGSGGWIGDPSLYRPVTLWSLAIDSEIGRLLGLNPPAAAIHHVSNTWLHALVAVLLFASLRSLAAPRLAAFAAAVLFAVHPIHTEAVASPVGRAEILAAGLGLCFLWLHRQGRPLTAAAVLVLSVFSKESGIGFLAVAAAVEWARPAGSGAKRASRWMFYGAAVAAALAWRSTRVEPRAIPFLDNPLSALPFLERLPAALVIQARYLGLQLAPVRLSSDYSFDQVPVVGWDTPGPWLVGIAIAVSAVVLWRARHSVPVAVAVAASYVALAGGTSNIAFPVGTILAERLAYGPSLAVCAGAGIALQVAARKHPRGSRAVLGLLAVVLAAATVARNTTWSDPLTFYREQVRTSPNSARAHFGLGYARSRTGDLDGAIRSYRDSISIYPDYAPARYNLGNALRRSGAPVDDVIEQYRQALRLEPDHPGALRNLARVLVEARRWSEAETVLRAMEASSPPHPAASTLRGILESEGARLDGRTP